MKIHLYDFLNKNKLALLAEENFSSVSISNDIDDFSTCKLTMPVSQTAANFNIRGFENIYVEDDDGKIIFGGVMASYQVQPTQMVVTCYDHRWVMSRLILDEQKVVSASDDMLDVVAALIAQAKAKRIIPIEFDRDGSAIAAGSGADLTFEIGDDIAGCLQKIIQTIYARWAVRYAKEGDYIIGHLVMRSVIGVTPEGVGISRAIKREDGSLVELLYDEGSPRTNMQDFNVTLDLSAYTSRTKLAYKVGDTTKYVEAPPDGTSGAFETQWGIAEGFVSDYNVSSDETAEAVSQINQTYPIYGLDITLTPDFDTPLNAGDRVLVTINQALLVGLSGFQGRIDSLSLDRKNGYWEKKVTVSFVSPQKRAGTIGFIAALAQIKQHLADLDKNYLKASTPGS